MAEQIETDAELLVSDFTAPAASRRGLRKLAAGEEPPHHHADTRQMTPARRVARIALYVGLVVFAIGLLTPFAWMVLSSLKSANEVFSVPVKWLPETFVWQNYIDIWTESDMLTWIRNTLFLAVVVTFLQVLTGSFAAYGFARMRFRGRDVLFLLYVGTIAVPWQSYMIPQFILMSNFKVSNTLWAIILLQAFGAFGVFLMKQFYETIPEELSEAARIDGLSEYGIWAQDHASAVDPGAREPHAPHVRQHLERLPRAAHLPAQSRSVDDPAGSEELRLEPLRHELRAPVRGPDDLGHPDRDHLPARTEVLRRGHRDERAEGLR